MLDGNLMSDNVKVASEEVHTYCIYWWWKVEAHLSKYNYKVIYWTNSISCNFKLPFNHILEERILLFTPLDLFEKS